MNALVVSLFRAFRVEYQGKILSCFEAGKVKELFCYLLVYRHRPHLRESLITILWSESQTTHAKKYLRQTLWQLQAGIEEQSALETNRIMLVDAEWVQINPEANIRLDVEQFDKAYSLVRGISSCELNSFQVKSLQDAVEFYRGDLLEGWYQDWCLFERERLQNVYLVMLDKLMGYCEARGNCEDGIRYGMQVLRQDRARERTHRRLMRLYYLAGDRTAAVRHYDHCKAALEVELNVKPARRTVELYHRICEDLPLDQPVSIANQQTPGKAVARSLFDLLEHFILLQESLDKTQSQIVKNIEVLKSRLSTPS